MAWLIRIISQFGGLLLISRRGMRNWNRLFSHSPFPITGVSVFEMAIEADVGGDFDRVIFRANAHVRQCVAEVSIFDYARAPAGVDLYFARQRNLAVEK